MPPELSPPNETPPNEPPPEASPGRVSRPVAPVSDVDAGNRSVPFEVTARQILQKCRENAPDELPPRSPELGEQFPFLGEGRTVAASSGRDEPAVLGDALVVPADHGPGSVDVRSEVRELYRREAARYLGRRVVEYAHRMERSPVPVQLFDAPTRVVDCRSEPPIGINWRVIMAPPQVVDHAVLHAIAHLETEDHSTEFSELVREHRPPFDYVDWLDPFEIALRLPP